MPIRIRDPETGREGTAEPDALLTAVKGGAQVLDPVEIYDPQTAKTGIAMPEALAGALQGGAVPVGSHAHKVATTGKLESFARGAGQGASFGLIDEALAGIRAPFGEGDLSDNYRKARDEYRANDAIAQEANPKTFFGGELGGGVASSFVPGLGAVGAVGKGATALQVAKAGAQLGALNAFGASNADLTKGEIGQAALDTGLGGLVGAGTGVATKWLGDLTGKGVDAVRSAGRSIVDPDINRAVALGAKTKEAAAVLQGRASGIVSKEKRALDELNRAGVFEPAASAESLMGRFAALKQQAGDEMQQAMAHVGDDVIGNVQEVFLRASEGKPNLGDRLMNVVNRARFDEADMAKQAAAQVYQDVVETGGNLRSLWEVKKKFGEYAGKAWSKPPKERLAVDQVFIEANDHLDDLLVAATDDIAHAHNIPGLSEANAKYAAVSTWEKQLAKQEAASKWQAVVGGVRFRDFMAGNMASGALLAAGVDPEVAMPLGLGSSLGYAAYRSTPGRLIRAKIGERMQQMAAQQGAMQGKLPRTAQAIQGWVQQNLEGILPRVPPEVGQLIQDVAQAAPDEAGDKIRSLMAMPALRGLITVFTQNLAPSEFATEVDGHISGAEDKLKAEKKYEKLGLAPSELAALKSQTNRTGWLDPSIFAPPASPDYGNIVEQFDGRLRELGY